MFKHSVSACFVLLFLLFAGLPLVRPRLAHAATRDGVTLPDSVTINEQRLVLNGLGTRKATIFGIRVYVAGLYLPSRSTDAGTILSSADTKFLEMRLVRDVSRKDMIEAWQEGFNRNVDNAARFKTQLDQVVAATSDVRSGDSIFVTFDADSVIVEFPRAKKAQIRSPGFGNALLAIWLGTEPPDAGLKAGMLGLS